VADLSDGARLLIWGMRHWMVATVGAAPVPATVRRVFELLGGSSWPMVAALLLLAARDADRPLVILPPCSPQLSADEDALTRAVSFAGNVGEARSCLRLCGCNASAALLRALAALAERFRVNGLVVALPPVGY
jgi:hypothetical protein